MLHLMISAAKSRKFALLILTLPDDCTEDVCCHRGTDGIAQHHHGVLVTVWQLIVVPEPHGGPNFRGLKHPHSVPIDDCPAILGRDRANRSIQAAPSQSAAVGVVGREEPVSEAFAPLGDALQCLGTSPWLLDGVPGEVLPLDGVADRHVLALWHVQLKRMLGLGADQEQALSVLRNTVISCIDQMRRHGVAKLIHGAQPAASSPWPGCGPGR